MRTTSSFSDYQPLGHVGRVPVHVTTIVTALFGVGLIASVVLLSARLSLTPFAFDPLRFGHGALWQPLTYAFIGLPSFFTLLGMLCFYQWALEVERYLGRGRFTKLFAFLLVLQPVVCSLWLLARVSPAHFGAYELTVAMLIAFATLYPNIEFFGWIPLKWFAFACVVIGSLMYFPEHNWIGLSLLWATCGAAFGYVRHLQNGGSVEMGELWEKVFRRRPKFRVVPAPARGRERYVGKSAPVDSIDPLLDKIAQHGMASLTAKERARLEEARSELLKKETR